MQTQYASFVKPAQITAEEELRNRAIEIHAITDASYGQYSAKDYQGDDRSWYRLSYQRIAPLPKKRKK